MKVYKAEFPLETILMLKDDQDPFDAFVDYLQNLSTAEISDWLTLTEKEQLK